MSEALARAFYDDPLFTWMFRSDRTRVPRSRRYFAGRIRLLLDQRSVYTTDGAIAGALWARPHQWRDPPLVALRQIVALTPTLGRRLPAALRGLREVESRHPAEPHWYLAVLGTVPERQSQGIASALLEPVLDTCDRDRVPAYLETAKERNIRFYERHGFRVTERLTLPEGPPVWLMWREPRA